MFCSCEKMGCCEMEGERRVERKSREAPSMAQVTRRGFNEQSKRDLQGHDRRSPVAGNRSPVPGNRSPTATPRDRHDAGLPPAHPTHQKTTPRGHREQHTERSAASTESQSPSNATFPFLNFDFGSVFGSQSNADEQARDSPPTQPRSGQHSWNVFGGDSPRRANGTEEGDEPVRGKWHDFGMANLLVDGVFTEGRGEGFRQPTRASKHELDHHAVHISSDQQEEDKPAHHHKHHSHHEHRHASPVANRQSSPGPHRNPSPGGERQASPGRRQPSPAGGDSPTHHHHHHHHSHHKLEAGQFLGKDGHTYGTVGGKYMRVGSDQGNAAEQFQRKVDEVNKFMGGADRSHWKAVHQLKNEHNKNEAWSHNTDAMVVKTSLSGATDRQMVTYVKVPETYCKCGACGPCKARNHLMTEDAADNMYRHHLLEKGRKAGVTENLSLHRHH